MLGGLFHYWGGFMKITAFFGVLLIGFTGFGLLSAMELGSSRINQQLMIAVEHNCAKDVISLITEEGAEVNCVDRDGYSPLMKAVALNKLECAELLLQYGAHVNRRDKEGCTPLTVAIAYNNVAIVELLLWYGAKVNYVDNKGSAPLTRAIARGNVECVRVLLTWGADIDFDANGTGRTSLMRAAASGNLEIVQLILGRYSSAEMARCALRGTDRYGETFLMHAAQSGKPAVVQFFLNQFNGCLNSDSSELLYEVNRKSSYGMTPLMYAIFGGNSAVADILLRSGADIDAIDAEERTAEMLAKTRKKKDLVSFFQAYRAGIYSQCYAVPVFCGVVVDGEPIQPDYPAIGAIDDALFGSALKGPAQHNVTPRTAAVVAIGDPRFI